LLPISLANKKSLRKAGFFKSLTIFRLGWR